MEMPKVNEHHQRMQRLAGTWVGEEKMPASAARGRWQGDTLTVIGRNEKNEIDGRYTFAFEGADRFRFSIENTRDGGKTWSTFMDALYKKTAPTRS